MIRWWLSLLVIIPVLFISPFAVALLLLTKWDGRSTWFGNRKYGRNKLTYWTQFWWLVIRNPIHNFLAEALAIPCRSYVIIGDASIGDHTHGGYCHITMSNGWEVYWIKPYGKRCIRFRAGWKINGKTAGDKCELVLAFNPFQAYTGD